MFIYSACANYKLIAKSWPTGCCRSPISLCFSPTELFSFSSYTVKLLHHTVPLWCLSQQSPQKLTNPVSSSTFTYLLESRLNHRTDCTSHIWVLVVCFGFFKVVLPFQFQLIMIRGIHTQDGFKFKNNIPIMTDCLKYVTALRQCLF